LSTKKVPKAILALQPEPPGRQGAVAKASWWWGGKCLFSGAAAGERKKETLALKIVKGLSMWLPTGNRNGVDMKFGF